GTLRTEQFSATVFPVANDSCLPFQLPVPGTFDTRLPNARLDGIRGGTLRVGTADADDMRRDVTRWIRTNCRRPDAHPRKPCRVRLNGSRKFERDVTHEDVILQLLFENDRIASKAQGRGRQFFDHDASNFRRPP